MTSILGIDPGNVRSASVLLKNGVIADKCLLPNGEFLEWLKELRLREPGMRVVTEMIAPRGIGIGRETLDTCVQIGRIQAIFPEMDRVTRPAVKGCLLGKAAGNDAMIRKCLIGIYGEPGTSKRPGSTFGVVADMWAACAVATAANMGCRLYETMGEKRRKKKTKTMTVHS